MIPLIISAGALGLGWLIANSHDKQTGLPRVSTVRIGTFLIITAWVAGVLTWPVPAYFLALWWVAGYLLLRSASRKALGWVSTGEVISEAVHCGWLTPLRASSSVSAALAGVAVAHSLEVPFSALLGTGVALMPVAWWLRSGWLRASEQQRAERRLAGTWKSGAGWATLASDRGSAPVTAHFSLADHVRMISAPIPAEWDSRKAEDVELDIQNRLAREAGERWPVTFDYGRRRITTLCVPPLPTTLALDPKHVPTDSHEVLMGRMSISRRAAAAGVGPYAHQSQLILSMRKTPHWLVVGETGSGKSVAVTSAVVQLAKKGWDVFFIDPKRVESVPLAGRQGIRQIAITLDEMTMMAEMVQAVMMERYDSLVKHGARNVLGLPEEVRRAMPPMLLVVDEAVELLAKQGGTSDEAKMVNDQKARIADALDSIVRLGRAADVHLLAACQRADRTIVSGQFQNNLSTVVLFNPAGANGTTRGMSDLNEVEVSVACPGRAVIRSIGLPESEMQGYYVDDDALDRWLPGEVKEVSLSQPDPAALVRVDLPEGSSQSLREQPGDTDSKGDDGALTDDELLGL